MYVCRTRKGLIRLPPSPDARFGSYPNRTLRNPITCHIQALRSANAYARFAMVILPATGTTKGCDPDGNETGRDRHGAINAARLRSPIVLYPASLPPPPKPFRDKISNQKRTTATVERRIEPRYITRVLPENN